MNSELVEELASSIDSIDVGKDAAGTASNLQAEQEVVLNEVVPVLEALLYAAEESVAIKEIVEVIVHNATKHGRGWANAVSPELVTRASIALSDRYLQTGSALHVMEVGGGLRLATRPPFDPWIRALRQVEKPSRLSVAALETLAVVAYRQPVTAAEIAGVRGVDPSTSLRTLRGQGMIRITGRKRAVGRPFTYGTTRQFLEIFGLRDLDELPDPEEFEELLEA